MQTTIKPILVCEKHDCSIIDYFLLFIFYYYYYYFNLYICNKTCQYTLKKQSLLAKPDNIKCSYIYILQAMALIDCLPKHNIKYSKEAYIMTIDEQQYNTINIYLSIQQYHFNFIFINFIDNCIGTTPQYITLLLLYVLIHQRDLFL